MRYLKFHLAASNRRFRSLVMMELAILEVYYLEDIPFSSIWITLLTIPFFL